MIITPDREAPFEASENIIIGNVALYGATSGEAYIRGVAGERFAVRNSGAKTVVEGVGAHGCEYMTGGTVVVLGSVGRNFAAGMSGGQAYLFDTTGDIENHINPEMVEIEELGEKDFADVRKLVRDHFKYTGSVKALDILQDWDKAKESFIKIMPVEYKRVLQEMAQKAELVMS